MPAIFLTAYDRPNYLQQALDTWGRVRGLRDWELVFRIDPGTYHDRIADMCRGFIVGSRHPNAWVVVNNRTLGVLHHPYVGFSELFVEHDFVIRAEDDLLVSDDLLEYFSWAEQTYRHRKGVATIHGHSRGRGHDDDVITAPEFNPLIWGTWRSLWMTTIGPLWDHDYSTFNGYPGNQSGWDWNLNTRLFPKYGYQGVYPTNSRVQNIGVIGTHSTPENFEESPSFRETYGEVVYRELAAL